ncbi:MAG TPA: hypothetical protein VMN79_11490 [Casimicrobiaceae bacterium]|nr:hypothetical protein [Casimicrobiaceae bacterium]
MKIRPVACYAALSCLAVCSPVSPAGAALRYVAIPLDAALPYASFAHGINATGDVAGEFWDWDAGGVAFRNVGGVMQVLGTMADGSSGEGIDDEGQVAVESWVTGRALLWSGDSMRDLGTLGGGFTRASSVSAGQVTGYSRTSSGAMRAFRYANGAMLDLGTLGGTTTTPGGIDSWGIGINQAGDVTGTSLLPDGSYRAFIYSRGAMRSLGTLDGAGDSNGAAINAIGQVTGNASTKGGLSHAFLYTNGTMLDLGTLGGRSSGGYAINARGDVTGSSDVAFNVFRAFLYADGSMYDLNSIVVSGLEGFALFEASGINDQRQIAATGCNGHLCRAFRLDPVPESPNVVVEYYYAGFDHYFMTANPEEIAMLDNRVFAGWVRTGQTFNVYVDSPIGTGATCRFFSAAFGTKSSHFYTSDVDECAAVKGNPAWQFEGIVFNIAVPDQHGACPPNTQPVYRLYNNGQGAAPNHRFTTSLATRAKMVETGWVPEGAGPIGVGMCAPQ